MHTLTDAERIARRYPQRRTPRWLWIALAAALAAAGGAWLVWSATYGANPAVTARLDSFVVTSDQTVDAVVTTQRPDPSRPATCTIIAQAVTYDTVGQYPLELAPSEVSLETHRLTIRTLKRATSVSVQGCQAR